MKLRIRGSSLRLRLGQSEVALVARGERVEDTLAFGTAHGARLVYALVPSSSAAKLAAHFEANEIAVTVPTRLARAWAEGSDVAIEEKQPIGDGTMLSILVEKDFACLEPRGGGPDGEDGDAYPNPAAT